MKAIRIMISIPSAHAKKKRQANIQLETHATGQSGARRLIPYPERAKRLPPLK
jgi:hypothetical protein